MNEQSKFIDKLSWTLIIFSGYSLFIGLLLVLLFFIILPLAGLTINDIYPSAKDLSILQTLLGKLQYTFLSFLIFLFLLFIGGFFLIRRKKWAKWLVIILLIVAFFVLLTGAIFFFYYKSFLFQLALPLWAFITFISTIVLLEIWLIWALVQVTRVFRES